MTVNIIHLPHRLDRRNQILEELACQGIEDYVIWPGLHDLTHPSKGIARAHQQVVSWALDRSLPEILIAEDDLRFTAKGAFQHFLRNVPMDFDLYLGGISYGRLKQDNTVDDFAGTHLYIIRKRFYQTFLSLSGENDIDRALARKGKYVVCNPMVAIQSDGYSDNAHAHRDNKIYFEKRQLWKP